MKKETLKNLYNELGVSADLIELAKAITIEKNGIEDEILIKGRVSEWISMGFRAARDVKVWMEHKYFYIIKVLDEAGNWYNNAFIENSYDAVSVAKFYREQLGYNVQLWYEENDVSFLMNAQDTH